MLPTKGFFKALDCPYRESDCRRPYCHFRHRKSSQSDNNKEVSQQNENTSKKAPPTYKPTPKSELVHIKSKPRKTTGYVPKTDESVQQPTYNPTPKSVLATNAQLNGLTHLSTSSINPTSNNTTSNNSTSNNSTSTNPTGNNEETENPTINNLDLEELLTEFSMIDDILSDSTTDATNALNVDSTKVDKDTKETKEKTSHESRSHRHKSKSSSRDKHKDHEKSKKERSRKDDKRSSRHGSSKTKSKKDKHSSSTSSSSKGKSSEKKEKESKESKESIEVESEEKVEDCDEEVEDDDDLDNMMIEDECLKIFNEYKPTSPLIPTIDALETNHQAPTTMEGQYEYTSSAKKRIAYTNASFNDREIIKTNPLRKPNTNVGLSIQNRIRMARQLQGNNEVENIMAELRKPSPMAVVSKRPQESPSNRLLKKPKTAQPPSTTTSNNLIDDIINGRTANTTVYSTNNKTKRIAPVSNVNSIQQAKAKIDEMKKTTSMALAKTAAKSYATKGGKRVAHVPDTSLSDIPDVLHCANSKLPVNVRTKFLCLMADECVKLYVSIQDAYQRALNEEFKVYQRCSIFSTYRNAAMLAVNRLRKELQERQVSGLGPLEIGESADGNRLKDSPLEGRNLYENLKSFVLSEEDLRLHGFPMESSIPGRAIVTKSDAQKQQQQIKASNLGSNQRLCCRCHKVYAIDKKGFPLVSEECCYHPLRKRTIRGEQTYLCCRSSEDTGCAISGTHVSEVSADRELEGYQMTLASETENDPRDHAVYALDCEMCYTTIGLELTRVTVVDSQLKTVYESLVKPLNPIIDYNTRFSGITKEILDKTSTNILQVQANIMHLCSSKTVLIGHSLESDMKALKIIHGTVVDTSVMFPHKFGLPHKRALKALASDHLNKIIQNDVSGHDSAEDALTAMELVLWKVRENLKVKGLRA